jgi:uncharacterized membrane protein YsdA (DUF1294 family)
VNIVKLIVGILMLTNLFAFILMGVDKRRAAKNKWRIPERTLLLACVPFSALGGLLGMNIFHHKTKKPKFSVGVPVMLLIECAALLALWYYFR